MTKENEQTAAEKALLNELSNPYEALQYSKDLKNVFETVVFNCPSSVIDSNLQSALYSLNKIADHLKKIGKAGKKQREQSPEVILN